MPTIQSLELDDGKLRLPLSIVNSFAYNKAANVTQASDLTLTVKGFACRSLSFSIELTPAIVEQFKILNTWASEYTFSDIVRYFIEYETGLDREPYNVVLSNRIICPELMFVPTQISTTFQADNLGNIQQVSVNFTLAGCKCTKLSSRDMTLATAANSILKTKLVVDEFELECKDDICIAEYNITPTTLHLTLLLSDSFQDKYSSDWLEPSDANTSYVEVENFGKFYIINSSVDDNIVTYDCSVFGKNAETNLSYTKFDTTVKDVLNDLELNVDNNLDDIKIDHVKLDDSSINILRALRDNLGFLVAFENNTAHCFEVPPEIPIEVLNNNENVLNFYCTEDIKSNPTKKVIIRDGIHEFSAGTEEGLTIIVDLPLCITTDRSNNILAYRNLMENSITLTVPFDQRIRHYSWLKLNLDKGEIIPCLVSEYSIDVLENSMTLTLNYFGRRGNR